MKKLSFNDCLLYICETVAALVFLAAASYLFVFWGRKEATLIPEGEVYRLTEWTYTDATGVSQVGKTPIHANNKGMDTITFETTLPSNITRDGVFSILCRSNISIYVDDECVYRWKKSEAPILGGPTKNSYLYVDLQPEYSGKTIKLVIDDSTYSGILFEGFVGSQYSVIREQEQKSGMPSFVLSLVLLIFSFIIVAISVALRWIYRQHITLIYGALGIFVAACWLSVDSFEFQFVTGLRFIDGFMSYICTLCIIFPFIIYLDLQQERRYRKMYSYIALLETANILVFAGLHVTGVAMFADTILYLDIVLGIGVVLTFLTTLYDRKKPEAKNYSVISLGFLIFMVSGILEIVLINSKIERVQGVALLFGLYVLLGFAIVQQIVDIKRVQTERNAANDAALAKTQFLANMSHEIRTPLNSILGMNSMILKEAGNPTIESYSRMISDSGQILLNLINDVLDFSKLQSGLSAIKCDIYNPTKAVEKVVAILKERGEAKGLTVRASSPQNFPRTLYGDEKHIVQILLNIITNAVKFTEEGSITFTAECHTSTDVPTLVFFVSDTGKGIKKEDIDSIFDPFIRKDLNQNRSVQGTGLGLSITKQLVDKMGGSISVDSVLGRGTTFRIEIPQAYKEGEAQESAEVDEMVEFFREDGYSNRSKSSKSMSTEDEDLSGIDENYTAPDVKILSVDDNGSNLVVVEEFLKDTSMTVVSVPSGKRAFTECTLNRFDLILMDHMMPEPDGIATMHMIRDSQESLNQNTPIIILTANAIKGSRDSYLKEGFDNYLSKPVELKQLLRMIRKYLPVEKVLYKPKEKPVYAQSPSDAGSKFASADKSSVSSPAPAKNPSGPLDINALYERFENRENTVNVILTEIVKEGEKKIALLPKLFNEGDIANYAIEAHGVKGVMASSCAQALSATAKSHEFAAKEGRTDFIRDNIDEFLKEYREVLDFVRNYLEEKGITVEVVKTVDLSDGDSLNEDDLIDAALDALNEFDVDKTLSVLEMLEKAVDEDKAEAVEKIKQLTDDFEYIKAIDALTAMKKGV